MSKVIETAPINVSAAEDTEKETALILSNANELVIKNQETYVQSADFLKAIKSKAKELEELRKGLTRPLDESKRKIMDLFRLPIEKLDKAEIKIKILMLGYSKEQERIRREQELKLQAEAEKKRVKLEQKAEKAREEGKETKAVQYETRAETITMPVVAPRVDKVNGIVEKSIWKARIVDEAKIPRAYLIPNMEAIQRVGVATKGSIKIEGIKFYSEEIISAGK